MPAPNLRQVARKGDLAFTDLTNVNGGLIDNKRLDAFVALVQAQPTLLNEVRIERIDQAKMDLDFAGFTGRISWPVAEHTALTEEQRSELSFSKVTLNCQDFAASVYLSDKALRNNKMKGRLEQFVMEEMARQVAYDMEEAALLGDTLGGQPGLTAFDGIIKQCSSHVIDSTADPQEVSDAIFLTGKFALPDKYWRQQPDLRFYVNPKVEARYGHYIAQNRQTTDGDRARADDPYVKYTYQGIPIRSVAVMPENMYLLTSRLNIVVALEEDVTYEFERDGERRRTKFILHYSMDAKFAVEDAAVLFKGIEATQ
ncbi:MAG: phage major capsid protein [Thermodesulfobacteriota bacterium]